MPNTLTTVITGGSSGLGLALAERLVRRGEAVVLLARNPGKLEAARGQLAAIAGEGPVQAWQADVTDADAIAAVQARLAAECGRIDRWINCAGVMIEGRFEALSDDDFRHLFDINFFGAVQCCRAALPLLRTSRGQLINIASMSAHTGVYGYSAYSASKHALKGFTESLYYELAPEGIRVQLICPPEFDSPLVVALDSSRSTENRAHTQMIPRETLADIADTALCAIDSGRFHSSGGWRTRIAECLLRYFPGVSRATAMKVISRASLNPKEPKR